MIGQVRPRAQVPAGWICVYDLGRDQEHIATVQRASVETDDFGFPTHPALFGTPEWWKLVGQGAFPSSTVHGTITSVRWAGMGDFPEFELRTTDGIVHTLAREGDVRRYVPGLGVSVRQVELPAKPGHFSDALGSSLTVTLAMLLEDSDRRSPGVDPGPGSVGYRRAGAPGTRVVYFWTSAEAKAKSLARSTERMAEQVHSWSDRQGGAWVALHVDDPHVDLSDIRSEVEMFGARYDGYDVIPAEGHEPLAHGPNDS